MIKEKCLTAIAVSPTEVRWCNKGSGHAGLHRGTLNYQKIEWPTAAKRLYEVLDPFAIADIRGDQS